MEKLRELKIPVRLRKHPVVIDGRLKWNAAEKLAFLFLTGGVGYGLIELLWRGHTHPSMGVAGGVCFILIYGVNKWLRGHSVLLRSAVSAAAITAVEFSVGIVVNRLLDLSVWDYSGEKYNLLGQICPHYSFLWFLLCIPLVWMLTKAARLSAEK